MLTPIKYIKNAMLDILVSDNDIVAVNKPAGILSVPGKSAPDNLYHRVLTKYPNARIIHRLDMATSGIMLFALNHNAQKHLGLQFENKTIKKQYTAVVDGKLTASSGEINVPLICDWPNRPKQIVHWQTGKKACTLYSVKNYNKKLNATRIALFPITGRSHQLRVHMQYIGHPILGDLFYATPAAFNKANRLLLHASAIKFQHPTRGTMIELSNEPEF